MQLSDLRRFRGRSTDDSLMFAAIVLAVVLGLVVVLIVGHPLDVTP